MRMLKYIFSQRRETKMVLAHLQSYQLSTNILSMNEVDIKHPKLTLLQSLSQTELQFPLHAVKYANSALVHNF